MFNLMKSLRPLAVGAAVSVPMILAGCGGGGGSTPPTESGNPQNAIQPSPLADCRNVSGQVDTAQTLLLTNVGGQLAGVPQVGATAQRLVVSIVQVLDVVDIVAAGATSLQNTQNPAALTATIGDLTGLLSCFTSSLSIGLVNMQGMVPGGAAAIPGMSQLMAQLNTFNTLLSGGLSGGLANGQVPTNFDLSVVAAQLEAIAAQAQVVFGQIQAQLPAGTPLSPLFPILTLAMFDATLVIDRIAALDGAGLATVTTFVVQDIATRMTVVLESQLNLPAGSMTPVRAALQTAATTVNAVLGAILGPLFTQLQDALDSVLGSILGGL